jgi:hypothetical protein
MTAETLPVRRTARRMADGREIIYFDDTFPGTRSAVDARPLPPAAEVVRGGLQMRRDPPTGEWITMAAHRNGVESAMGAWINDTTGERVAARLREV